MVAPLVVGAGIGSMKGAALALLLILLSGLAGAAHITDKLVVGLYPGQKLDGKPSQLLTSGTPIEVLKRAKGVVQVRLSDGASGWLEARYVSEEKPAAMKLLEAQAELRQLKSRLEACDNTGKAPDAPLPSVEQVHTGLALNQARTRIAELEAALADLPQLQAAADERDELQARLAQVREIVGVAAVQAPPPKAGETLWDRYLPWVVAGLMGLVGFAAGVGFIDYRIRRRYSGLRF